MTELTPFERTRLLGSRALQLSLGAPPLVKVPKGTIDPYIVALLEFDKKKLPLAVLRSDLDGSSKVVEA